MIFVNCWFALVSVQAALLKVQSDSHNWKMIINIINLLLESWFGEKYNLKENHYYTSFKKQNIVLNIINYITIISINWVRLSIFVKLMFCCSSVVDSADHGRPWQTMADHVRPWLWKCFLIFLVHLLQKISLWSWT